MQDAPLETRRVLAGGVRSIRSLAVKVVPAAYLLLCVVPYLALLAFAPSPYDKPTPPLLTYVYPYVDLDGEANVATWFSSTLLLLCALTAIALALAERRRGVLSRLPQALVAVLFLYLSVDETGRLHEFLDVMLAQRVAGAIVGYEVPHAARVWALFALPTLAAVGVFFTLAARRHAVLARTPSACFLVGFGAWALGLALEVGLGAPLWAAQRITLYRLEVAAEETAEIAGTFFFLLGLLHALETQLLGREEPLEAGRLEAEPESA